MRLVAVAGREHEELLDAFYRGVYWQEFAARAEPLETWKHALWGGETRYRLRVTLAVEGEDVVGGIAWECYPRSRCGLITYCAVAAWLRGRGVGSLLIEGALAALVDARAVFGETEAPERFVRWGGRPVGIAYVQPSLGPGLPRGEGLTLIAFGARGDAAIARELVDELYEVCEGGGKR